jgi:hypothetical protein
MSGSLPNELLTKYKSNNQVFFETGTSYGDTVQTALDCGFQTIYSVELNQDVFNSSKNRFKDSSNVFLYNTRSDDALRTVLPYIEEPVLFWLDAHKDCNIECTPLMSELEAIKGFKYPVTILIDDMRLVGIYEWNKISLKMLIDKIKEIDPNLDIIFEDNSHASGDILVAYDPRRE